MGDAFLCEMCAVENENNAYHDGDPAEKLFRKEVIDRQGTDYIKVADLCEEHAGLLGNNE